MSPRFFDTVPGAPDPELEAVACACLQNLLPTLTPEYSEVIDRIDLRDEPREQVAADLGVSVTCLGVRLRHARQALKARLVEMCLTCPEPGLLDCGCGNARYAERLRAAAAKDSEM